MTKEEEMQQKVVLYQLLQKHMEELKQQGAMLEARFMEFEATKQALLDFKDIKGKEILIPIGSGCYAKGKAEDSKDLLVNIGANLMVKKPLPDTAKLLDERIKEIEELSKSLQEQMTSVMNQLGAITQEFEKLG